MVPTIDELVEKQRAALRSDSNSSNGDHHSSRSQHHHSPLAYDRAPSPSLDFEDIHNQFYNNDDDLGSDEASGGDASLAVDASRPAAQDQHILDLIHAATDPEKQINMCSTWHPWF